MNRTEQKCIILDKYEFGALLTALTGYRNMQISKDLSKDMLDDLIIKLIDTPYKKVKIRNESR